MFRKRTVVPIGLNPEIPHRTLSGQARTLTSRHPCACYYRDTEYLGPDLFFHGERQDTASNGWKRLLELVEKAAVDKEEEFNPLEDLTVEERRQIVTLPPSIATLTHVRNFNLYDSNLIRIPPEIGEMASLETFTPYTSYRLHWFPYEIIHCKKLTKSLVSTRALYGNYKTRPPFPQLQPNRASTEGLSLDDLQAEVWGTERIQRCSVCGRSLEEAGLNQVWISLWVAAFDVLPLLVNACSRECILRLPTPPKGYVQEPHKGGPDVKQPPAFYSMT